MRSWPRYKETRTVEPTFSADLAASLAASHYLLACIPMRNIPQTKFLLKPLTAYRTSRIDTGGGRCQKSSQVKGEWITMLQLSEQS